jgi:hypothetical protein
MVPGACRFGRCQVVKRRVGCDARAWAIRPMTASDQTPGLPVLRVAPKFCKGEGHSVQPSQVGTLHDATVAERRPVRQSGEKVDEEAGQANEDGSSA